MTNKTVFEVASLSKQFTGFGIAILIGRGIISLDDNIRDYIPELYAIVETTNHKILIYEI